MYEIVHGRFSSYYTTYSGILSSLSHFRVSRLVDYLEVNTKGYVIQTITWGFSTYYLFETLNGEQVVINKYGVKKIKDSNIKYIQKNKNDIDVELLIDDISDLFIDFEDDGHKVNVIKIRNGWEIVLKISSKNSLDSLKKLESVISTLNESLDRVVKIYGYLPEVTIDGLKVEIKITKI